jgi:hypothetical protein
MFTSARIRSGFKSFARASASCPFATAVTATSSVLKIIPMAVRMVVESSATSRDLGMRKAPPRATFHVYLPCRDEASFRLGRKRVFWRGFPT